MDEKTAELRDLFVDATGSETVTERQEAARGTLVDRDDEAVGEGVRDLVAAMRERYSFSTPLGDDAYALVARGRFADESDAAVAAAIRDELGDREDGDTEIDPDDIDAESVRKARLDLHLVRESDREVDADGGGDGDEPPFAYADLKRLTAAGNSIIECADRFRDAFRDLLTDADIEGSLASDAREDGLREATEDIETDVSL
jgi:hypothetical protein